MAIPAANVALAQSIFQQRLGQPYVYGGHWTPNPADGTDCSGLVGEMLEAVTKGTAMVWGHPISTESWPYDYNNNAAAHQGTIGPYGTIAVASPNDFPPDAAMTIAIMHGGGGANSHMNCTVAGVLMEDNGDVGVCTRGTGAVEQTDSEWTDWWYLPGPITGSTPTPQPIPPGGFNAMADAQSVANDNAGVDGNGKQLPWRSVHLLRDAQIGDLSTQSDGDAEGPNISSSLYDQTTTLAKILTRRYKGKDVFDILCLIGDHLGVL